MKLTDKLTELGYVYDEGLWISNESASITIYVTEIEDGVQIARMPEDTESPALIVRFNRYDSSVFVLLESWAAHA